VNNSFYDYHPTIFFVLLATFDGGNISNEYARPRVLEVLTRILLLASIQALIFSVPGGAFGIHHNFPGCRFANSGNIWISILTMTIMSFQFAMDWIVILIYAYIALFHIFLTIWFQQHFQKSMQVFFFFFNNSTFYKIIGQKKLFCL